MKNPAGCGALRELNAVSGVLATVGPSELLRAQGGHAAGEAEPHRFGVAVDLEQGVHLPVGQEVSPPDALADHGGGRVVDLGDHAGVVDAEGHAVSAAPPPAVVFADDLAEAGPDDEHGQRQALGRRRRGRDDPGVSQGECRQGVRVGSERRDQLIELSAGAEGDRDGVATATATDNHVHQPP